MKKLRLCAVKEVSVICCPSFVISLFSSAIFGGRREKLHLLLSQFVCSSEFCHIRNSFVIQSFRAKHQPTVLSMKIIKCKCGKCAVNISLAMSASSITLCSIEEKTQQQEKKPQHLPKHSAVLIIHTQSDCLMEFQ